MITVTKATGRNPVFWRDSEYEAPYPAYIYLDCDNEELYASAGTKSGCWSDVLYERRLGWRIHAKSTCKKINALLKEIAPFAERVIAGYFLKMIDNNVWGDYDKDALAALDKIESIVREAEKKR